MKKSKFFSQLAIAGIASGMLSLAGCNKPSKSDGAAEDGKQAVPTENQTVKLNNMPASSMMDSAHMDTAKVARHGCKGMNACKGQGGCAVSEKDLKDLAAKAGMPMEKAGKAHGCKGMNACKGLGGCKS